MIDLFSVTAAPTVVRVYVSAHVRVRYRFYSDRSIQESCKMDVPHKPIKRKLLCCGDVNLVFMEELQSVKCNYEWIKRGMLFLNKWKNCNYWEIPMI